MQSERSKIPIILAILFIVLDLVAWFGIFNIKSDRSARAYFLNVGQGDSELIVLQSGARILFDAGPDGSIVRELDRILGDDKYIDIGVITHPESDHFGGYKELMARYEFGAIVTNGEDSDSMAWKNIVSAIDNAGITRLALSSGDRIAALDGAFEALSPGLPGKYKNANEKALVGIVYTPQFSVFLASDMDSVVERALVSSPLNISADIMKIAHHGSKYSNGSEFIGVVNPVIGIAEVGRGNRYGHPSKETLDRFYEKGVGIFRTDQDGSIMVENPNGELRVLSI